MKSFSRYYNKKVFKKVLLVYVVTITIQGCFLFGSGDDTGTPDVCEDVFNAFVSQDRDGIGVTSERCVESERGAWIEGRCYCHGAGE